MEGDGSIKIMPDSLTLQTSVKETAKTAPEIRTTISSKTNQIINAVKMLGYPRH